MALTSACFSGQLLCILQDSHLLFLLTQYLCIDVLHVSDTKQLQMTTPYCVDPCTASSVLRGGLCESEYAGSGLHKLLCATQQDGACTIKIPVLALCK